MKIILPSFAIGIFSAATLLAQTESSPNGQGRGAQAALADRGTQHSATLGAPTASKNSKTQAASSATAPLSAGVVEGADLIVQNAADALAKHQSISARVRFHVDAFGYRPIGQGTYLQQGLGAERKVRWELKTSVGEQISLWQQICDGKYLWLLTEFSPEQRSLDRIDLRTVRQALEKASNTADKPLSFKADLAIGGLPQVAESLRKSFRFTRAEAGQLDQLPVWIVTGSWRPEVLKPIAKELAEQAAKGNSLDLKKLPPQMPEEVHLYLGQDDLFPYRIDYRRRGAGQGRGGEGSADEMKSMVLVELYEVRLNDAINPREFEYDPQSYSEATEGYLKTLGVK
jgi:hypothetical protein